MKISSIAIPAFSLAIASASVPAFAQTGTPSKNVGSCLAAIGSMFVPWNEVGHISTECKKLLFPPNPNFSNGPYRLAGDAVREYALSCEVRYGTATAPAEVIGTTCGLFYYPSGPFANGALLRIKIPPAESGGLF